jgi:hypothetical protein
MSAKTMRASLLAVATATSLKGLVSKRRSAHLLKVSLQRLRGKRTAWAPTTSSLRKYLLPILETPPSGSFPPDEFWRGASPKKAANSRGPEKAETRLFEEGHPGQRARVADLALALSYNGRIVGTPEQIANQLEQWQDAGVDGVNVTYQTTPGSFREFIEQVIPEMQRRGLAQREYAHGTLRERLFAGRSARLPDRHPAAKFRGAFTWLESPAFADVFVRREALQGFQPSSVVVGVDEVGKVSLKLIVSIVVRYWVLKKSALE